MTHVFTEHQRLAWFLKAFDKRRRGDLFHVPLITSQGHWEEKERIPAEDLLSVCCGSFLCGYHTIQDAHISGLGASHTHMPKEH